MAYRLMTVVGARPQFVKAAVVSHEIARIESLEEVIVHTGQHYDENMSQAFFDELEIPEPKINLGISGGSHAEMTAAMLVALESTMLQEHPDAVLLYGDTNSTLAEALAAAKLHIPIVHVEAGARTWSMTNPEEINRLCADRISSLLLASTLAGAENLKREGLGGLSQFVGDPMYDAFVNYRALAKRPTMRSAADGALVAMPERYYYLTCHREENTGSDEALRGIFDAAEALDAPMVYPVHPRVRRRALSLLQQRDANVIAVDPVGYLESIYLVDHAEQVITDSGGLQREAFFAQVKCTTLLDYEVWPETMIGNRNMLASPERRSILQAMEAPQAIDESYQPFGAGDASVKIVQAIMRFGKVG